MTTQFPYFIMWIKMNWKINQLSWQISNFILTNEKLRCGNTVRDLKREERRRESGTIIAFGRN